MKMFEKVGLKKVSKDTLLWGHGGPYMETRVIGEGK